MMTFQPRVGPEHPAGAFRIRRVKYAAGTRQSTHFHEYSNVTLVLAGSIRESTRRGEEIGGALSVVVKPAGQRHADEVGPQGATTIRVAFEPDQAEFIDAPELRLRLDRWRWIHGRPAAAPLTRLGSRLKRESPDATEMEELVLEAMAALVHEEDVTCVSPPGWLVRVREALDDELMVGIKVQELARIVGAHPVSVARAFRRHYGLTIGDYRRRERLRRAAALITGSGEEISDIAHATGYSDHAHLCRELRRLAGITPTELRRLAG